MKPSRFVLILSVTAMMLSGCGSEDGDSAAPVTPTTGAAANTATAKATTGSSDGCGDTADKVRQHVNRPEVKSVELIGQCTTVSIKTTLGDDDTATAKELCDSAAEVGYSALTNGIEVTSTSSKALAVGIKGAKCLATS